MNLLFHFIIIFCISPCIYIPPVYIISFTLYLSPSPSSIYHPSIHRPSPTSLLLLGIEVHSTLLVHEPVRLITRHTRRNGLKSMIKRQMMTLIMIVMMIIIVMIDDYDDSHDDDDSDDKKFDER